VTKVRLEGETPAVGAMPVPLRLTVWVLPLASLELSVTVSVPVLAPLDVGVKATLMVQLPLAASDAAQLPPLAIAKLPLAAMAVMASEAPPVLERVAVMALLVVLTN
jgi:hypothetical protein